MDIPQSINEIIEQKNILKESISAVDIKQFDGQTFGSEGEYIYKGLLGGIDSLLLDVTTLTKVPKQFLKISTYQERNNIRDCLINANSCIQNPNNLFSYLDKLKQAIRPFHIRYTKESLLNFDEELSELTSKKIAFSNQLSSLEKKLTASTDNKNKFDKELESLKEQQKNLTDVITKSQERLDELNNNLDNCNNNANHLSAIKQQADSHQELIDNFVAKIAERETQLENQTKKTEAFNEKLEKFTEERDGLLKTAESLIKEAKTALNYKKVAGIAAAFQNRLEKLEPKPKKEDKWWKQLGKTIINPTSLWIIGAMLFSGFAIYLSYEFIGIVKSSGLTLSFSIVFARLSMIALPVAGAWFCAGQYTKLKNIAEDYAYKTVLAQSIIGFSEQLKDGQDDASYKEYIKKMLDEIHKHPLRNHKKYDKANSYSNIASKVTNPIGKQMKNNDGDGS